MLRSVPYLLAYPPAANVAQQVRIVQRAVELGQWHQFKVFVSPMTACVVLCRYKTLTAVSDPHVDEWRDTFHEIDVGALLARISQPDYEARPTHSAAAVNESP